MFIPIDRTIPYIDNQLEEYARSPARVITTINDRRQKYQEDGDSLEGRPFLWDTVPRGQPRKDWTGQIAILGLQDDVDDPDISKCTPGKSNFRKMGKDPRYTGQARRPAQPKTQDGRNHRLSYVEPTVLSPTGKHQVIS